MKLTLLKSCVIGVGKTGSKGETLDFDEKIAKQLLASSAAAKPGSDEAKTAVAEAKAAVAEAKAAIAEAKTTED